MELLVELKCRVLRIAADLFPYERVRNQTFSGKDIRKRPYERVRNQAFSGKDIRKRPYERVRNQAFIGKDISKPYTKKLDFLDFVGNQPCHATRLRHS